MQDRADNWEECSLTTSRGWPASQGHSLLRKHPRTIPQQKVVEGVPICEQRVCSRQGREWSGRRELNHTEGMQKRSPNRDSEPRQTKSWRSSSPGSSGTCRPGTWSTGGWASKDRCGAGVS